MSSLRALAIGLAFTLGHLNRPWIVIVVIGTAFVIGFRIASLIR